MRRIAICDDEILFGEHLEKICLEYYGVNCSIDIFVDGDSLLNACAINNYEVIFLDIDLNGRNGIEIKNILVECRRETNIIFVSGYREFMQSAFGVKVWGFLDKPADKHKVFALLKDIDDYIEKEPIIEIYDVLKGNRRIKCNHILYIVAEMNYTRVVLLYKKDYIVRQSMTEWENLLNNASFMRVHRSYIVNLNFIRDIDKDIYMASGEKIPLSRRKMKACKMRYGRYCKS